MIDFDNFDGLEFKCKCGELHSSFTRRVVVGEDKIMSIAQVCREFLSDGFVAVCCMQNCLDYAEKVENLLKNGGYIVKLVCFADDTLACKESAQDLIDLKENVRLIVSIGGGSIAQLAKYAAKERNNQHVHVMTCTTTADILSGRCFFDQRVNPPSAVIYDPKFCKQSDVMIGAGYGEICSYLLRDIDVRWACRLGVNNSCGYVLDMIYSTVQEYIDEFKYSDSKDLLTAKTLLNIGLLSQLLQEETTLCDRCVHLLEGMTELDPMPWGIKAMIVSAALISWYKSCFKAPESNLMIGFDRNEAALELCRSMGFDSVSVLTAVGSLEYKKQWSWVLKEYRAEVADDAMLAYTVMMRCVRQFRRIFGDAGYFLSEYLDSDVLLDVIKRGIVVAPRYSIAVIMAESGILLT
ncbi:MAG: iron-containing alcohol dehydrogenase [Christensenellales bacterium]